MRHEKKQLKGVRLLWSDAVAVLSSGAAAEGCVDDIGCPTISGQSHEHISSLPSLEAAPSRVKRPLKDAQPVVEAEFAGDDEGGADAVAVDAASVVAAPASQLARSVSSSSSFHETSSQSSSSSSSHGKYPAPIGVVAEPADVDAGGGSTDSAPWHCPSHILGQPMGGRRRRRSKWSMTARWT